jgi:DNA-binding NtrC family response regulator
MHAFKLRLLIVDDDEDYLVALRRGLSADYQVITANSPNRVMELVSQRPDVAMLDLRLEENSSDQRPSLHLLEKLRILFPDLPVVMITAFGDMQTAIECMRLGACDFIQKPLADIREIRSRLSSVIDHSSLARRVLQLQSDIALIEPREIVGMSPALRRVKQMIQAAAQDGQVTVLLRGETGTGKELVARAIHASGRRANGPFTAVSLTALPGTMIEAELFGFEAGAFTDARTRHAGYLEQAERGVLFLDEIGEAPPSVQVKLLRFLEEREVQRIGATRSIQIDTQVIAATNADLESMLSRGDFREDLYFRLHVCEIVIPSLAERRDDIPDIALHLIQLSRRRGHRVHGIAPEALCALQAAEWPGNVRQLKNALERAVFSAEMNGRAILELEDITSDLTGKGRKNTPVRKLEASIGAGVDVARELARVELSYISNALKACSGKKADAWRVQHYNDRFAIHRRLRALFRRFPDLNIEFPDLVHGSDKPMPESSGRRNNPS